MLGFLLQELYLCQYRYSLFITNTTEALLPALLCRVVVESIVVRGNLRSVEDGSCMNKMLTHARM